MFIFSTVEAVQTFLARMSLLEMMKKFTLATAKEAVVMIVVALEQVGQLLLYIGERTHFHGREHLAQFFENICVTVEEAN